VPGIIRAHHPEDDAIAAAAMPPVVVQNYQRAPVPDVPGIIRANGPEDEAPAAAALAAAQPVAASSAPAATPLPPVRPDLPANRFRPDPPDVPGIIRAPITGGEGETFKPAVEPLFSHEGLARKDAVKSGWKARAAAVAAGSAAAFAGAGSALADKAGPRFASLKSGMGTVPARVGGATTSVREGGFRQTRLFTGIATVALAIRVGAVWIGSALAVVLLPILLGLGRFVSVPANAASRWFSNRSGSVSPDFDEDGNPRRKRPVAPFWIAFAGFYAILALIIGVVWFGSAVGSSPASPGAIHTIFIADWSPSPSPSPTATPAASASSATTPGASASSATTPGASASTNPGASPSTAPIGPVVTPGTTPKPTAKITPVPTAKITPVPTVKITPVPVPTPTPVMFETIVSATPPASHGSGDAHFVLRSLPTAVCYLHLLGADGTRHTTHTTMGGDGESGSMDWTGSSAWTAQAYTMTLTCTMPAPDSRSTSTLSSGSVTSITMP
jgi:hypothetical protein